jgi:hypothetical protein
MKRSGTLSAFQETFCSMMLAGYHHHHHSVTAVAYRITGYVTMLQRVLLKIYFYSRSSLQSMQTSQNPATLEYSSERQ